MVLPTWACEPGFASLSVIVWQRWQHTGAQPLSKGLLCRG